MSSIGKVRDVRTFEQTVENFQLIPTIAIKPTSLLFILGEFAVTVQMLLGGIWLIYGFVTALGLLTTFTLALVSVMRRKVQIPCNCFGKSDRSVSPYVLWRNSGFIICSFVGLLAAYLIPNSIVNLNIFYEILVIMLAVVFVIILTGLSEVLEFINS